MQKVRFLVLAMDMKMMISLHKLMVEHRNIKLMEKHYLHLPIKTHLDLREKQVPAVARVDEGDIFVEDGIDYAIPGKEVNLSPLSEDMEESTRNKGRPSYFSEPVYGPVPPPELSQDWQQTNGFDAIQTQVAAAGYQQEWQDYQYAEQLAYPEQYFQQNLQEYDLQAGINASQDSRFMTQEDKDRGLGSVFKRDDQRLQQLSKKDVREKDPNFMSESYSECYPGYQEYNREVVDSDDEADLSKMDMGGRVSALSLKIGILLETVRTWSLCLKQHGSSASNLWGTF